MKKLTLTLLIGLITLIASAQTTDKPKIFKYVTEGPDGAIALTVLDDSRKNKIELQSVDNFYKYQLRNIETGDLVFTNNNKGKTGIIDKSKLASGNYNLVVYTKSFIITSEITIMSPVTTENSLAMTEEN